METLLRQLDELDVRHGEGPLFAGFAERRLAKSVGLSQFGVNHVTLAPGSRTSSRHWHEAEDEFVLVLADSPTLIDDNGAHALAPGMIAGFPAGVANAHHLVNEGEVDAVLLVVGSRRPGGETVHYPDDNFGPIRK